MRKVKMVATLVVLAALAVACAKSPTVPLTASEKPSKGTHIIGGPEKGP